MPEQCSAQGLFSEYATSSFGTGLGIQQVACSDVLEGLLQLQSRAQRQARQCWGGSLCFPGAVGLQQLLQWAGEVAKQAGCALKLLV